jgi:hypothetical protein
MIFHMQSLGSSWRLSPLCLGLNNPCVVWYIDSWHGDIWPYFLYPQHPGFPVEASTSPMPSRQWWSLWTKPWMYSSKWGSLDLGETKQSQIEVRSVLSTNSLFLTIHICAQGERPEWWLSGMEEIWRCFTIVGSSYCKFAKYNCMHVMYMYMQTKNSCFVTTCSQCGPRWEYSKLLAGWETPDSLAHGPPSA